MRLCAVFLSLFVYGCGLFSNPDKVELRSPDGGPDLDMRADAANNATPDMNEMPRSCGDGALQPNELCDPALPAESAGACPESCDDGVACTADRLIGSPDACNAACTSSLIDQCVDDDGCCPEGCGPADDTDCDDVAVCGDGFVSGGETCDPGISGSDSGECPTDPETCPSTGVCERPRITGAPQNCDAACAVMPVTACADDGCCPTGCDATVDVDCSAVCGNDVVEPGENCDGNCPSSGSCDDGDACTVNSLDGTAADCDAVCVTEEITACTDDDGCCPAGCNSATDNDCSASCDNGVIDPGETCDPMATCATTCDDNNACTIDLQTGSAANCNFACSHTQVTVCQTIPDGCCPPGCNANNDFDCAPVCGNGAVESGETCDGNCPQSCDDGNVCTADTTDGAEGTCTLACVNAPINTCIDNDGCCPSGCNAINDDDCGPVCGNTITEPTEICDGNCPSTCNDGSACTVDVRTGTSAQCNVMCQYSPVTACTDGDGCCPGSCDANNDSDCSPNCGNGVTEGNETCDGNCPSSGSCAALDPCSQLTGDASSCNAACVPIAGCQPCNRAGVCNCPAGDVCAGTCKPGNGMDCHRACDPNAYCEVYLGPDAVCVDDRCLACEKSCPPYQLCVGSTCEMPPSCDQSPAPDQWCFAVEGGGTCVGVKCQ